MESQTGKIILSSDEGHDTLAVDIADTLKPGAIEDSSKVQTIEKDSIPLKILCTKAKGGSCRPRFLYQWQESPDGVHWTDIEGATDVNLSFSASFPDPLYFRREVKEVTSNYVSYSDIASVYIQSADTQ